MVLLEINLLIGLREIRASAFWDIGSFMILTLLVALSTWAFAIGFEICRLEIYGTVPFEKPDFQIPQLEFEIKSNFVQPNNNGFVIFP